MSAFEDFVAGRRALEDCRSHISPALSRDDMLASWDLFLHKESTSDLAKILSLVAENVIRTVTTRESHVVDWYLTETAILSAGRLLTAVVAGTQKALAGLRARKDAVHAF